jgi:hypothetical protein
MNTNALSLEELDEQHAEVLPVREEMLLCLTVCAHVCVPCLVTVSATVHAHA